MLELMWWMFQPSSLLLVLLLVGVLALRARWYALSGLVLTLTAVVFVLVVLFPVGELLVAPLEQRIATPQALPENIDGIVVLGGAVDWRVTQARGQLNLNSAAERLMAAAALAERYPDAKLVLTGVFSDAFQNEFGAVANPQSFFFGTAFEGRSVTFLGAARSTYEEALLTLETVQPRAGERWLLVTSALHMPRAQGVFQTLGWQVMPYPVDYRSTGRLTFSPNLQVGRSLSELDLAVREWGALLVYERTGRIDTSE